MLRFVFCRSPCQVLINLLRLGLVSCHGRVFSVTRGLCLLIQRVLNFVLHHNAHERTLTPTDAVSHRFITTQKYFWRWRWWCSAKGDDRQCVGEWCVCLRDIAPWASYNYHSARMPTVHNRVCRHGPLFFPSMSNKESRWTARKWHGVATLMRS